jgi:dTMP kinase
MGLIGAETPDLTLVLDIDPTLGLKRSRGASVGEDRFEQKTADFHRRVREAFLGIARDNPARCVVLDAGASADAVLAAALAATRPRLNLPA